MTLLDFFLGWDVGGTKSSAVIGGRDGVILAKTSWPSNAERGPEAMLADFFHHASSLQKRFGDPAAVSVSVGGPMDTNRGVILSPPNLPGWDNFPLRDILARELKLPVRVEHDAVACLLAEHLWGGARGATHAIYITAGTGCGAGIMVDRTMVRGPAGQTTEVGHIRLAEHGPVAYGKAGCVESFCSGTGIALLAREMFPAEFPRLTTTAQLARVAEEGNVHAHEVLCVSARWMGRLCAMLADIFSPQVIMIGSLARYLPSWWLEAVKQEFHRETLSQNRASVSITPSALGDRLQDLSALAPGVFSFPRNADSAVVR